jgi:hypothetical protein
MQRQLVGDVAFDFKLLKAYRDTDGKARQKHIKTWTYRKSCTKFRQASLQFIEDFRWDLKQIAEAQGQRAEFLNVVKKFFLAHGMNPKLRR